MDESFSDDLTVPAFKFKSSPRCIPSSSSADALGRFTTLSPIQQVHLLEVHGLSPTEGVCSGLEIRARLGRDGRETCDDVMETPAGSAPRRAPVSARPGRTNKLGGFPPTAGGLTADNRRASPGPSHHVTGASALPDAVCVADISLNQGL